MAHIRNILTLIVCSNAGFCNLSNNPGMKKSKHSNNPGKRSTKKNNNPPRNVSTSSKVDSIDEDDQGFGRWLRSTEGMENMKLFVIANSIVLLTTLAYPHLQVVFELITDAVYGADGII